MDLNFLPLPEGDEEYYKNRLGKDNVQHHRETSVNFHPREREEQMRRIQMDNRQNRMALQSDCNEGPYSKKPKYDKNKLPSGWLDCPKHGENIGFIIPSKVPLDQSFDNYIPKNQRYSFREVFYDLQEVKRLPLNMVVDLTNTDRYYRKTEVTRGDLKYLKIRCLGRDAVPDNESVNTFVFEVMQFLLLNEQMRQLKYVLVHCTHGHNRTGYMIVHYLMRTQQASSVSEAIQRFAAARPPGIYKQDYIDALYSFYHEPKPDLLICPPTPEWKRYSDVEENGAALPEDDDGVPYASIDEKHGIPVMMTNDDVLGDNIPYGQECQFRYFCYEVLKPQGGSGFPGSHPVSLNRDKLQLLRQRYYYATWKADGTRYMLLLAPDGCYLVDRGFKFWRVQMSFPCKIESQVHQYTLLDGEMIIDTVSPRKQERRYLIYDLIAINGVSIIERPFSERWKMIEKEVIEPRNNHRRLMDLQPKPPYRYDLEPFRVRRKDFWLLSTVEKLLKGFIPNLSHDADGLIFQGWDDPYIPRTHEGLLKWKYPEMNSVDFRFEIGEHGEQNLYLNEKGKARLMVGNRVTFGDIGVLMMQDEMQCSTDPVAYGSDPSSYSGKIIECSWDSRGNVWVYMRTRPDKLTPNEFSTFKKVMRSIRDNITQDVVLNEIGEIIRLPMYADRIQNDSKPQKKGKPSTHRNN